MHFILFQGLDNLTKSVQVHWSGTVEQDTCSIIVDCRWKSPDKVEKFYSFFQQDKVETLMSLSDANKSRVSCTCHWERLKNLWDFNDYNWILILHWFRKYHFEMTRTQSKIHFFIFQILEGHLSQVFIFWNYTTNSIYKAIFHEGLMKIKIALPT